MRNVINIDLWFWHLDEQPATVARWRSYLDQPEQDRMARFKFERDQTRFTICRSRLRRILGWYTSCQPRDVIFDTTGRSKPILKGCSSTDLQFNLTHTDGLACLAIAMNHAVGIDLEKIRPVKDDFIAHTLNPAELAPLEALTENQRQTAFFRIWTAKEAYLKAVGTGLWQSLKAFDVAVPLGSRAGEYVEGSVTRIESETLHQPQRLYSFAPAETYAGALAIALPESATTNITTRWLTG